MKKLILLRKKMATTLYMDKETRELLEQARLVDPNFNLSQFVKKSLGLEVTGKSESQENVIQDHIKEAILVEHNAIATRELWVNRLESYRAEQKAMAERKEKERKDRTDKDLYQKNLKERENRITEYFEKNGWTNYKQGLKEGKWTGISDYYDKVIEPQYLSSISETKV